MKKPCLSLWLIISFVLLITGIFSPTVTMQKFMVWKHTVSIASGLMSLLADGEYGLFLLIFSFSVVFPIVKNLLLLYIVLFIDWTHISVHSTINWLERLGRWSMLDVFVVALLVIVIKFRFLADVEIHRGVYLFAASVLMTNLAATYMSRLLKR